MRSKFSPRQKVVSFALAILVLGLLVVLGYRFLGNIFASDQGTTQKIPIKIGLSNWDGDPTTKNSYGEDNQALYFKYVDDKKYRCDVITIYLANAENGTTDQEKIQKNRDAVKLAAQTIVENSGLVVYGGLKYEEGVLKGQGKTNAQIGAEFKKSVIIPGSGFRCQGTGTDSVSYGVKFNIPAEYQNSTAATATPASTRTTAASTATPSGSSDSLNDTTFDQISYGATVCIASSTWKATYTKESWTDTRGSNDSEYGHGAFKKTKDFSGSGAPQQIYQGQDNSTYDRVGFQGKGWTISNGECSGGTVQQEQTTTPATGTHYNQFTAKISVKNGNGKPIKDSRVEITKLDQSGRQVSGTSADYLQTDSSGTVTSVIKVSESDSSKVQQIQGTAEKFGRTQSKQVAWSGQSEIAFDFVLQVSDQEAESNQTWTATGGDQPYVAPVIDTDNSWPGGPNTLDLIALRRSKHNANYNGYTPVGGVEYYINIYTNSPPASTRKTNTGAWGLSTEKALAQCEGEACDFEATCTGDECTQKQGAPGTNTHYTPTATPFSAPTQTPAGASTTATPNGNGGYGFGTSGVFSGNSSFGAAVPYDQSKVAPYSSALVSALRKSNSVQYAFSTKGRIVDNGLNSLVSIGNLPSGIYDIMLVKPGFYSSRFVYIMNNGEKARLTLPIAPQAYAEPPSIDSGTVQKLPNKDVYGANGYIYVSKYPWFGWQKENEYIYQKPNIENGVPTVVNSSGQLIGSGLGTPEMQACIGKKMQSVGVGVSGLTMQDVLLGAGGAYLLKQSSKQNNDWVQGGMIAGGIFSLIELAKTSDAKVNINYDQYDCAELLYGRQSTTPVGCSTCFMNTANSSTLLPTSTGTSGSNCDPRCFLQYSPWTSSISSLPLGNLFTQK